MPDCETLTGTLLFCGRPGCETVDGLDNEAVMTVTLIQNNNGAAQSHTSLAHWQ